MYIGSNGHILLVQRDEIVMPNPRIEEIVRGWVAVKKLGINDTTLENISSNNKNIEISWESESQNSGEDQEWMHLYHW